MKITLLGTGTSQGIPIIGCKCKTCLSSNPKDKRLRTSVYIAHKGKQFVIDTGPDFRQQMLRENIEHIDFLLFTHNHKDHIAGLDDIRAFNHIQKQPIDIYANAMTCRCIHNEFSYAFYDNPYPGVPEITLHEIDSKPFSIQGIDIQPIDVIHFKLPILAYRIDNFAYITDASYIADSEIDKLYNLDLLVVDALRIEKHYSHFCLEEALNLVKKIQPKQTIFTHISHYMGLHEEVNNTLLKGTSCQLGYDGLSIEI